jgi:hypothetical protein
MEERMGFKIGQKVLVEDGDIKAEGTIQKMEVIKGGDGTTSYLIQPLDKNVDLCGCGKKDCKKSSWFGDEHLTVKAA